MTRKLPVRGGVGSKPADLASSPVMPNTSDLADSGPGAKLGTLRDAIERAKARRTGKITHDAMEDR
jgi:hypothetical protein